MTNHLAAAGEMKMLEFTQNAYLAFDLAQITRAELITLFPPKHEKVICDHVTIVFRPTEVEFNDVLKKLGDEELTVKAFGYSDSEGFDCFSVTVNGMAKRQYHGFYHVTHSLAPGWKAFDSNRLLLDKRGVPSKKFDEIALSGTLKFIKL